MSHIIDPQPEHDVRRDGECRMPLGETFGDATVVSHTNWTLARTLFEITAPRVEGTMTVYPNNDPKLYGSKVEVKFGDVLRRTANYNDSYRPYPRPITVNGITILGAAVGDEQRLNNGTFRTYGRRDYNTPDRGRLPERTQDRLTAVTRAVLLRWFARPDVDELWAASARCNAPRHLTAELRRIAELDKEIAAATAARAQHLETADGYRALIAADAPALEVAS